MIRGEDYSAFPKNSLRKKGDFFVKKMNIFCIYSLLRLKMSTFARYCAYVRAMLHINFVDRIWTNCQLMSLQHETKNVSKVREILRS